MNEWMNECTNLQLLSISVQATGIAGNLSMNEHEKHQIINSLKIRTVKDMMIYQHIYLKIVQVNLVSFFVSYLI